MRAFKIMGWIAMGLAGVTAIGFVLGLVVMMLWNWLMPALFGVPEVTYWQAVGLFVLCHLLFKGHGGGGHRRGPGRPHDPRGRFARKVKAMMGDGGGCSGREGAGRRAPQEERSDGDRRNEEQ